MFQEKLRPLLNDCTVFLTGRRTLVEYLSQALRAQLAVIHRVSMTTRRTVPGHIVIRVLRTKRVLKLIRLRAPILRDEASVNSRLCNSITLLAHIEQQQLLKQFRGTE